MTCLERDNMEKSTKMFDSFKAQKTNKQIIKEVYNCLEEKDYNPIDQLVGYIISGDPSYITSYNNARALIKSVDRDELVAEMEKVTPHLQQAEQMVGEVNTNINDLVNSLTEGQEYVGDLKSSLDAAGIYFRGLNICLSAAGSCCGFDHGRETARWFFAAPAI